MSTADSVAIVTAAFTAAGVLVAWMINWSATSIAKHNRVLDLHRQFNAPEFYAHIRTVTFAALRGAATRHPGRGFDWRVMANTDFADPASIEIADPDHNLVEWAEERRADRSYWKGVDGLALDSGRRSSVLLAFFTELEILIRRGQVDLRLTYDLFATPWAWFEQDIHSFGCRILQRRQEQRRTGIPDKSGYRRSPWQVSSPRLNTFFRYYPCASRLLQTARSSVLILAGLAAALAYFELSQQASFAAATRYALLVAAVLAILTNWAIVWWEFGIRHCWTKLPALGSLITCLLRSTSVAELAAAWGRLTVYERKDGSCDRWFVDALIPSSKMGRELEDIPDVTECDPHVGELEHGERALDMESPAGEQATRAIDNQAKKL